MKSALKFLVVLAVLACVGWLRMPFEQRLSLDLTEAHLLSPSFDRESRASLSQKGFVASFGSLRPMLAAFTALSTTKHHGNNDWENLEQAIETTVLLDPYNGYYWDLGAWHLAYNASTSSLENDGLAPLQAKQLFEEYIHKGDNLYTRGIAANPNDIQLRLERARLWSSRHKIEDYPKVAQILRTTLSECELSLRQRQRIRADLFYTLLRIPQRVNEAYILGRELYEESAQNHFPSLLNGLCALQMHPWVKVDDPLSLPQLYSSRTDAIKHLGNYLNDNDSHKPRYGVQDLLDRVSSVDH
ncbi:hypothetical protein [Rubritalea profundi]|uniref:DUF4034 domain-containing protein n=1 Tax=Rubritalea profundi TaxID=1658618 RepID=A0A2S7U3C5_9BACT|nr:hypothetical protein [Rubritalea profundi]PQJ29017.1 hypothetical protein BSZ32_11300 [Rubritalea profundi]